MVSIAQGLDTGGSSGPGRKSTIGNPASFEQRLTIDRKNSNACGRTRTSFGRFFCFRFLPRLASLVDDHKSFARAFASVSVTAVVVNKRGERNLAATGRWGARPGSIESLTGLSRPAPCDQDPVVSIEFDRLHALFRSTDPASGGGRHPEWAGVTTARQLLAHVTGQTVHVASPLARLSGRLVAAFFRD